MINNIEELAFEIIGFAGTAKGLAYEALDSAECGDFNNAQILLDESDEVFKKAHRVQSKIIQDEVNGEKKEISLLLIHAENHLMASMESRDLIEKMIKMYKHMAKLNS